MSKSYQCQSCGVFLLHDPLRGSLVTFQIRRTDAKTGKTEIMGPQGRRGSGGSSCLSALAVAIIGWIFLFIF